MNIGTISIIHCLTCRLCDKEIQGGTNKRANLNFIFHMQFRHFKCLNPIIFYQLWRWNP